MGAFERRKGAEEERAVVRAARGHALGAERLLEYRRNEDNHLSGWDVLLFAAEKWVGQVKRRRSLGGILRQAIESLNQACPADRSFWWVRRDREQPVVILRADDFFELLSLSDTSDEPKADVL